MKTRHIFNYLRSLPAEYPAVALPGLQQVGKIMLALEIVATPDVTYRDPEFVEVRAKWLENEPKERRP